MVSLQIRSLRLAEGLTQAELADRSGIAQPNLAAFESGSRQPSLFTLGLISSGLGVEPGRLLDERPVLHLDRFAMDGVARALVAASKKPSKLPAPLWRDLQAVYFSKMRSLAPALRRVRPRLSAHAAQRRAQAWLGPAAFEELTRRLDKFYPEKN